MNGQFLTYLVNDDETLEVIWEHSKYKPISSLELYVEKVHVMNKNMYAR